MLDTGSQVCILTQTPRKGAGPPPESVKPDKNAPGCDFDFSAVVIVAASKYRATVATIRARGVEYDLDFDSHGRPMEARLVHSYDTGIYARAKGSYRRMPNSNGVYCLGLTRDEFFNFFTNPFYIETTSDGKELIRMDWDLKSGGYSSYRGQSDDSPTEVHAEVEKKQFEHWVDIPEGAENCKYFHAVAFDDQDEEMNRSQVVATSASLP
ncbi:unnamed protein product [Vitrella brassicaformis CCMP3155]|uniref:Uncharacterized protein n=1 Tax=Vitrella brassicaformis (strain CCMP3155) TaxID=1169540 RepID=A0A0G4FFN5_VITBC|nr:unnamed protein product [Vitrella brassicaformis CCMP3155]|eukprot:CEM11994.1 unnamed protein product [Vitrella brassicaformis CCMP3155]